MLSFIPSFQGSCQAPPASLTPQLYFKARALSLSPPASKYAPPLTQIARGRYSLRYSAAGAAELLLEIGVVEGVVQQESEWRKLSTAPKETNEGDGERMPCRQQMLMSSRKKSREKKSVKLSECGLDWSRSGVCARATSTPGRREMKIPIRCCPAAAPLSEQRPSCCNNLLKMEMRKEKDNKDKEVQELRKKTLAVI